MVKPKQQRNNTTEENQDGKGISNPYPVPKKRKSHAKPESATNSEATNHEHHERVIESTSTAAFTSVSTAEISPQQETQESTPKKRQYVPSMPRPAPAAIAKDNLKKLAVRGQRKPNVVIFTVKTRTGEIFALFRTWDGKPGVFVKPLIDYIFQSENELFRLNTLAVHYLGFECDPEDPFLKKIVQKKSITDSPYGGKETKTKDWWCPVLVHFGTPDNINKNTPSKRAQFAKNLINVNHMQEVQSEYIYNKPNVMEYNGDLDLGENTTAPAVSQILGIRGTVGVPSFGLLAKSSHTRIKILLGSGSS